MAVGTPVLTALLYFHNCFQSENLKWCMYGQFLFQTCRILFITFEKCLWLEVQFILKRKMQKENICQKKSNTTSWLKLQKQMKCGRYSIALIFVNYFLQCRQL